MMLHGFFKFSVRMTIVDGVIFLSRGELVFDFSVAFCSLEGQSGWRATCDCGVEHVSNIATMLLVMVGNVGHGVVQGTPEENVGIFCDAARASVYAKNVVNA